jgi:hypothetical protein
MFRDSPAGVFDFREERGPQTRTLEFVVLSGVVEFSPGGLNEILISLQARSGVAEYIGSHARGRVVPRSIAPLRFLGPNLRVLLVRQIFEALEQTFRQSCTVIRSEL